MAKTLFTVDENGYAWFTINRPEKRNAIDYDVMQQLNEAIVKVKEIDECRAFIITGKGDKAFCSGGDLSLFHSLHTKEEAYPMLARMGEILYSLLTLPIPTVALLNGTAIGGGCEIASACDYRLAKMDSKVGFVQGKLAITTGWGGASMLYEKLPYHQALEMLMSAKTFSGEQAFEIGFVHKLLENENIEDQCKGFLKTLTGVHVSVLKAYKSALISKWVASGMKERMFKEIEQCSVLWESDEHHQVVAAFLGSK